MYICTCIHAYLFQPVFASSLTCFNILRFPSLRFAFDLLQALRVLRRAWGDLECASAFRVQMWRQNWTPRWLDRAFLRLSRQSLWIHIVKKTQLLCRCVPERPPQPGDSCQIPSRCATSRCNLQPDHAPSTAKHIVPWSSLPPSKLRKQLQATIEVQ